MSTATTARGPPPSSRTRTGETTTDHAPSTTDHPRRKSTSMIPSTTATVVAYHAPSRAHPSATVEVACPYGCVERTPTGRAKKNGGPATHLHGIGPAGAVPDLGSRVSHCPWPLGRTYLLTDPNNLVPERLEVVEAVTR